ncbi:SDR family oxidoreductase [uncultured Cellulomonas sp.]|uniref:SDR family oxidoreductase n=1 Tax=uncultured Cellulomonas sp. TaxID=189682 RepID=UPI00260BD967|nr:SDR family oxidoreductase [uncultured Cellulomonas sp.]
MPYEKRDLTGTVVAITGASAGIGRSTALMLAEAGADVVLGARRTERLDELVEQIGPEHAVAVATDVRDPEQNRALVQAAVDRFGKLDTLVANAGIGMYGGIEDGSDEDIERMLQVNLTGTVWSVRAAVPELRRAGGGDIIIVASVAGLRGDGNEAVYASTKFGQVGLAGALDRELRADGIRVTALCPAGVTTEFAIGAGRTEGDPALEEFLQPEDIAFQVLTCLQQPRRLRSTLWSIWSMAHDLP